MSIVDRLSISRFFIAFATAVLLAAPARAQDAEVDAKGFQQNRDYFSQLPFESIDTLSGSLVLTFTDLVLPGNAGRELRLQRTYNSKTPGAGWTFSLAGMVMSVYDPPNAPAGFQPLLNTADGASHATMPLRQNEYRWVVSGQFLRYDRIDRKLYYPDGLIADFDSSGHLTLIRDTFGNKTFVTRSGDFILEIKQELAPGHCEPATFDRCRRVTFDLSDGRINSMTYATGTRTYTWNYTWTAAGAGVPEMLATARPPAGPAWTYGYEGSALTQVTTPSGGVITYTHQTHAFPRESGSEQVRYSRVVSQRATSGRDVTPGTWTYEYYGGVAGCPSECTKITGPAPTNTEITYEHGPLGIPYSPSLGSDWGVRSRTVRDVSGTVLETETRQYVTLPVIDYLTVGGTPELFQKVITRDARTYTTTLYYSSANFGDYHRPYATVEVGDNGLIRTTARSFDYGFNLATTAGVPYFNGKVATETVQVAGLSPSYTREWQFDDATGFITSETVFGIPTTFERDAVGNVYRAIKANGHFVQTTFDWGVVDDISSSEPGYGIGRVINPEGTVAQETQAGRTVVFGYDDLFRMATTRALAAAPDVSAETRTTYDPVAAAWQTVSRGDSSTTITVDGFGRPIRTVSGTITARAAYDADGRKTYEGYPLKAGFPDVGVIVEYDALGRIRERRQPGAAKTVRHRYDPGSITVTDENDHSTTLTRQAFGNPDDAWIRAVRDADGQTWTYSYNALGKLTKVDGPPGPNGEAISRSWVINSKNLVESETHPESGTVSYHYDAAGVVDRKTDGNNIVSIFELDGNDRVKTITTPTQTTTFSYETGSDNLRAASVGNVITSFTYDSAGRLKSRDDVVDGRTRRRIFTYDANDNIQRITYPSGRIVEYTHNNENQIIHIRDLTLNKDLASDFQYHPSGAMSQYRSGNGLLNTMTFDGRYRPDITTVASRLQLRYYNYDDVGNVRAIDVLRPSGTQTQTFDYDNLDRLRSTAGAFGSSFFFYDAHGNRLSPPDPSMGLTTYRYKLGTMQMIGQGDSTFSYDDGGNLRSGPNATYGYTPDNLLATATVGSKTATYAYDANGWRVKKESTDGDASVFLRGPHNELLTEVRKAPNGSRTVRDYIYAGDRLIASVDAAVSSLPAPTNVTAVVTGRTVSVNWNHVAGAISYVLQAGSVPGGTDKANFQALPPLTVSGVAPGTYYVRVYAEAADGGLSAPSAEITVVVQ